MRTTYLIPALLMSGAALAAQPTTDLDRVDKDITIMKQIIATSFKEAGICRDCGDTISGRYLAEQGIVFSIRPSVYQLLRMQGDDEDEDMDLDGSPGTLPALPELAEIPAIVGDALQRINVDVDTGDGHYITFGNSAYLNRETREKLREVAEERRDVEERLRDAEISMIHAEDKERAALEKKLSAYRAQLDQLQNEKDKLDAARKEQRAAYEKKRDEQRKELEAKRAERLAKVESTLLETVCDYGSTMKSLPASERVSLIVDTDSRYRAERKSRIYVLSRSDIGSCRQGEWQKLKDKAIIYDF